MVLPAQMGDMLVQVIIIWDDDQHTKLWQFRRTPDEGCNTGYHRNLRQAEAKQAKDSHVPATPSTL